MSSDKYMSNKEGVFWCFFVGIISVIGMLITHYLIPWIIIKAILNFGIGALWGGVWAYWLGRWGIIW